MYTVIGGLVTFMKIDYGEWGGWVDVSEFFNGELHKCNSQWTSRGYIGELVAIQSKLRGRLHERGLPSPSAGILGIIVWIEDGGLRKQEDAVFLQSEAGDGKMSESIWNKWKLACACMHPLSDVAKRPSQFCGWLEWLMNAMEPKSCFQNRVEQRGLTRINGSNVEARYRRFDKCF